MSSSSEEIIKLEKYISNGFSPNCPECNNKFTVGDPETGDDGDHGYSYKCENGACNFNGGFVRKPGYLVIWASIKKKFFTFLLGFTVLGAGPGTYSLMDEYHQELEQYLRRILKLERNTGQEGDLEINTLEVNYRKLEQTNSTLKNDNEALIKKIDQKNKWISELETRQLTRDQEIDLGLFYAQGIKSGSAEKRDPVKAKLILFPALKDSGLNAGKRKEIIRALVGIRYQIEDKNRLEVLLKFIKEYRYGFNLEMELALIYYALAHKNFDAIPNSRRSFRHFLKVLINFPKEIPKVDIKNMEVLLKRLISKNLPEDKYLVTHAVELENCLFTEHIISGYCQDNLRKHLIYWAEQATGNKTS